MSFSFGAPAAGSSTGAGTSLFGDGASTNTASKPLFGGFSTPNPQQQGQGQQQPGGTVSLFGAQAGQPAAQPAAPAAGGLFGSASTQPGSQQQQQQQTAGTTGGLFGGFGQTQTQQQPAASTGGGLFGSTNTAGAAPTSTGLFGSTTANAAAPAAGGGLFGNLGASQQQQQQQQQPKPATSGLFGSALQPQQQQQPSGIGLFGSNAPASTLPQAGGGLFGGFGATQQQQQQQQQQQPAQGLFASQNNLPGSSLNASVATRPGVLGGSLLVSGLQQRPEVPIEERMLAVQRAWDTNSPDCRFKYFFYNVVEPGTTYRYGRPAGATDDAKWAKALRENPDSDTMVPVLATGWTDVKKRVQLQENIASVHQEKIKEITQALAQLTRQTSLSSSIRLTALQQSLTQQLHRLIHLASLTPQFIPILHSTAFRPEETELKARLEGVKAELDGRAGSSASKGAYSASGAKSTGGRKAGEHTRMLGQVNELWGAVEELRRRKKRIGAGGAGPSEDDAWLADERVLAEIAEILSAQQLALSKLTDLMNNGMFDTDVIKQGLSHLPSKPNDR